MSSSIKYLTALPVFNELASVTGVLDEVARHATDVLVVDDGSDDGTSELLARRDGIYLVRHPENLGYGAALQTAFQFAIVHHYDVLVTIDCDGQHEPQRIAEFVAASTEADIVSGSRYLRRHAAQWHAPANRRQINMQITEEINRRLGLALTDAFCGFKAYRVQSLAQLDLSEAGYGMPLELWVQAAHRRLSIREMEIPLIYLDEKRSFGGALDSPVARLKYYYQVIERAEEHIRSSTAQASRYCLSDVG